MDAMLVLVASVASGTAAAAASLALPPIVWGTYCAGSAILVGGCIRTFRCDYLQARGLDKVLAFGPVLFAAPLAVFGAEHLTIPRAMAPMVPQWIPGHLFWVLLVGVALIAAAFSIVVRRLAAIASALLGIMFFCFVVLMDVPGLASAPHDRFAQALTLRELTFSVCALALASTLAHGRWRPVGQRVALAARSIVGAVVVFYGVEHFLHPQFVPVIPLELKMPAYILFHPLWAYGVGTAMIVGGLAMLANWRARTAATILGIMVCAVVVLFYGPLLAAHPADIDVGMNYFADTLFFGGAILVLAGSIPRERRDFAPRPPR